MPNNGYFQERPGQRPNGRTHTQTGSRQYARPTNKPRALMDIIIRDRPNTLPRGEIPNASINTNTIEQIVQTVLKRMNEALPQNNTRQHLNENDWPTLQNRTTGTNQNAYNNADNNTNYRQNNWWQNTTRTDGQGPTTHGAYGQNRQQRVGTRHTDTEPTTRGPNRQQTHPTHRIGQNRVNPNPRTGFYQQHEPTRNSTSSTNPEFTTVCKEVFKLVQLEHHEQIWSALPPSLKRNLTYMGTNITPPDPTDTLRTDMTDILTRTGEEIRTRVHLHIRERLAHHREILTKLDPTDKETICEVVYDQITRRLGSRINNVRQHIAEVSADIGTNRARRAPMDTRAPTNTAPTNTTQTATNNPSWTAPRNTTKRLRSSPTPSPQATTENRFLPLAGENDAMDTNLPGPDFDDVEVTTTKAPTQTRTTGTATSPKTPIRNIQTNPKTTSPLPIRETTTPQANSPPPQRRPDTPENRTPRARLNLSKTFHDKNWPSLTFASTTHTVILGDSNLRNVKDESIPPGFQVDIIPGAHISHITNIATKIPEEMDVIIAVGINHRSWNFEQRTLGEINQLHEACTKRGSKLHAMGISINPELPENEIANLTEINKHLFKLFGNRYIFPLSPKEIRTYTDEVHYDARTTQKIWYKITHYMRALRTKKTLDDNNQTTSPTPKN